MTTYPIRWNDDGHVRAAFAWQAWAGIAPKFGSRPIGWYQQQQCQAHEVIVRLARGKGIDGDFTAHKIGSDIWVWKEGDKKNRVKLGSIREIYNLGDQR